MTPTAKPQRIVFFHPDLGIGGAERLVIDAAVGLQNLGHNVTIFTSHCDKSHCFEEARDGTLDVRVRGNTIVPSSISGRLWILCAILRQLHLIVQITLLSSELRDLRPESLFIDQLSAGVPLLRILSPKCRIIFYCHFPDKLLAKRGGLFKSIYRVPFDWLESWTTGCSDTIVVNSNFTRSIFKKAFPGLWHRQPGVIYPCVDTAVQKGNREGTVPIDSDGPPWSNKKFLLSINRFEEKKDIGLAIRAYAGLSASERAGSRLVIAGGFDPRNAENQSTYTALDTLASSLSLRTATAKTVISALSVPSEIDVLFLHSVPTAFKDSLLKHARLLIYTPLHEHFGIVPLEAMLAETPVLAADEGGPTETVVDGETGWLRNVKRVEDWTEVMRHVLDDDSINLAKLKEMGSKGKIRVRAEFSKSKMAERLDIEIRAMYGRARPSIVPSGAAVAAGTVLVFCLALYLAMAMTPRESAS